MKKVQFSFQNMVEFYPLGPPPAASRGDFFKSFWKMGTFFNIFPGGGCFFPSFLLLLFLFFSKSTVFQFSTFLILVAYTFCLVLCFYFMFLCLFYYFLFKKHKEKLWKHKNQCLNKKHKRKQKNAYAFKNSCFIKQPQEI